MRGDDSYRWGDDPRDLLDVSDLGAAAGLAGSAWVTCEAWEAQRRECGRWRSTRETD